MTLAEGLKRQNNNADLLRLVAACAVIWGHSYALTPEAGFEEPIGKLLGFDYSGSLAVKFFFLLSGLLVTNSWLSRPSLINFISARVFRIFPSLIVSSALCMLVLGALLTTLPATSYYGNTWMYWHIFMYPYLGYELPGVFTKNTYHAVNGSLWTIPYELLMYAYLLGIALCGVFRHKMFATIVLSVIVVCFIFQPEQITVLGMTNVNDAGQFPAFFAFGSLLALHKDNVRIGVPMIIGLFLITWLLRNGPAFRYAFYLTFALTPLWLMTLKPIKALRTKGDYSYGVYVYGWPIQQTIAAIVPNIGVHANQFASLSVAIIIAAVSWHIIEKPFISIGRQLPMFLNRVFGLNKEMTMTNPVQPS